MLFPYCEHLRNFEFKYNLFQKYADFCETFSKNILESLDEDGEIKPGSRISSNQGALSKISEEGSSRFEGLDEVKTSSNYDELIHEDMMEGPDKFDIKTVFG